MTARPVYPIHSPGEGRATTEQVVDGLGRLADALDSMDDVPGMTVLEERLSTIDTSGGGWYRHLVRGLEDTVTNLLNMHKAGARSYEGQSQYGKGSKKISYKAQKGLDAVLLETNKKT